MTAPAAVLPPHPGGPVPAYMRDLVDRAAALFTADWPTLRVEFAWWSDGLESRYFARLSLADSRVRLKVFCARSGEFVCQSMVNDLFLIDPTCVGIFSLPDDEAREEWNAKQCKRPKA